MKRKDKKYLEKVVELVAQVLHEVHLAQLGQDEVDGPLGEGHLGVGQPGPVVGVRAPGVGVLEREGQAVVDGGKLDRGGTDHAPFLEKKRDF